MSTLNDILNMRGKDADAFLSMCHLYNDTNKIALRKSLVAGMKSISSSVAINRFFADLDLKDNIDLVKAEELVDSISSLKISASEKENAYADYIDNNLKITTPFMVKGTTKTGIAFYIRYGVSLNKTYMENHFNLIDSNLNGPAYQLFVEQLTKSYVEPNVKKFVKKNRPDATVRDAKCLENRHLLTVDVLIPITVENCTDEAILDAVKFIDKLRTFVDDMF